MRTIHGNVAVPADATRIVAPAFPETTALAELGIKPVGVDDYLLPRPACTAFQ